jgi:cytochrome P450
MVRPMQAHRPGTARFALGTDVTLEELEADPHALLARLREREPVSWLPVLGGWLVTRRDLAMQVMRDARTFTVDDPRFSTGQVVGPSMLTRDGAEHRRHREPFVVPFRRGAVQARFGQIVGDETERLIDGLAPAGGAELRRALAGPLAVAVVTHALGIQDTDSAAVLGWYDEIVAAVTDITAGRPPDAGGRDAYAALSDAIGPALDREPGASLLAAAAGKAGGLERERVISNAAVLLFGGIETTEGMIANAVWHLLSHPGELALVAASPDLLTNAIEESLRLEPAAAIVDRYATADVEIGDAAIARGGSCACRSPRPTATPRRSRRPTASTSAAPTRASTSRSRTAPTRASRCTSRAWRPTRPSRSCSPACRTCTWTRTGRPRRAGSCSASRRSCTCAGRRDVPSALARA